MTVRCPFALGALLCLVACGVSPRPESADAQRLPERELDDATVRTVAATAQRAIEAVVNLQYPDAEQAALAALDLDPRCARARAVLAMVKLKRATPDHDQPELGAAEFELRLAQQLGPDDAFVGWMTAVFLAEAGHMAAAAQAADQALRTSNTASAAERAALLGIAGTYRHELGEERAAIPHLQEYVALRPDDITARYRLASALLRVADEPRGIPPTSYLVAQRQAEDAARA